ncbi:MAG: AAA family ATPase [Candidatus Sungbacteria bacterium]|nr:AAA family ATPase [Candidatus Sungbacteria bacterium]
MIPYNYKSQVILGHKRQIAYLDRVMRRSRLAHAYLFFGPEHVGKLTIARTLAQAALCQNNKEKSLHTACGDCASCRSVEAGADPRCIVVDPASALASKKETRKEISIDDIRELKRLFAYGPEAGQWRVVIINEAERLSQEASNALLKILEEPGEKTLLVLASSAPDLLPSTIRSRTVALYFGLVADNILAAAIRENAKTATASADQNNLVSIACGRPGILLHMLADKEYRQRQQDACEQAGALLRAEMPEVFRLSAELAADADARDDMVRLILAALRNHMHEAGAHKKLLGHVKEIDRIATLLTTTNVNPRLAMDMLLWEAQDAVKSK